MCCFEHHKHHWKPSGLPISAYRNTKLQSTTNLYVIALAVSDLLCGTVAMPLASVTDYWKVELNRFRRPKSRFCWYIQHWCDPGNSWFNRVQPIIIKVSRTVQLIEKLRHFLPTPTLLNIYQALIAPYLTYGLTVWGQACKSYLDKLLKLQKRALCFIYFSDHNEHAIPLFVDAHILPLKFVHYESIANLMFDVRNRTAPSNIQDLFKDISNVHSYNPFKRIPSLE